MKFTTTLTAALLASVVAMPAMAGSPAAPGMESNVYTPPSPDAYLMQAEDENNWDGFYVGLGLGVVSQTAPDGNGFDINANAGYNMDLGDFVVGAELGYSPMGYDLDAGAGKMKSSFGAKLRAGYDAGKILPYVTLGVKNATADFGAGEVSDTGVTYGLGVDYMLTDSLVVGGELTQSSFSDFAGTGNDVSQTSVGAKISMKF